MNKTIIFISRSHEAVSHHARELWLQLGSPDGQDLAIWLRAEREIIARPVINPEELDECFDSYGSMSHHRGPTALQLT